MRLFGSLSEIQKVSLRADQFVLQLTPNSATTYTADRTVELPPGDADEELVGKAATQTLTNKTLDAGSNTITGLTDAAISVGAAIELTKLAAISPVSRALIANASGQIATSAVTSIELGYLSGADSNIQDQIDGHVDALAAHGTSSALVGINDAQTLLNKTLTNPKINEAVNMSATSTELNYVKGVTSAIQTQLNAKATDSEYQAHAVASAGVHGVTGDLVGTTDAQTLTNKTINGATIAGANINFGTGTSFVRFVGPTCTTSQREALSATAGLLVYDSDTETYWYGDGTTWHEVGSGASGGSSGKNYVAANPSAAEDTSGWAASAGTLSRTTTAVDLPRGNTTGTAFAYTSSAADDYVSFNFNLDAADEAAANLLSSIAATIADSGWQMQIWSNDADDFSGTYTQVKLVDGDSDGSWDLTTGTRVFTTWWTPDGNNAYQLRLVDTVGGQTLYWSDSLIGPDKAAVGAAVGPIQTFTPSVTSGGVTFTDNVSTWQQDTESMIVTVDVTVAGVGSATASGIQFAIPDSKTANPDYINDASSSQKGQGFGSWYDNSGGTLSNLAPAIASTSIGLNKADGTTDRTLSGTDVAVGDRINFTIRIPIAEWAGSGTVGLGTNRVEYKSVGGTWDADSSTTVDGPRGSAMGGALTAARDKTITWDSSVQPTDRIQFWVSKDQVNWGLAAETAIGASAVPVMASLTAGGSSTSGVAIRPGVAANQTIVRFRQYQAVANDDSPGLDWSSSDSYWCVTKCAAGVVTGYGQATADVYGLVKGGKVPGVIDGASPTAGYVGETKSVDSAGAVTPTSGQYTDGGNAGITLTPGAWIIKGHYHYIVGSTSSVTDILYGIGTASGNSGAGLSEAARSYVTERPASHTPSGNFTRSLTVFVNISTTTTFYPKFRITGTIGTGQVDNYVDAIRLF